MYDEKRRRFHTHITVTERKTGKQKTIALSRQAIHALRMYYPRRRSGGFIFAGNRRDGSAVSRVQAWRIIRAAVAAVGIAGKVSCHSLRKSWGYHAWTGGGVSPVVIMDVLNHSNYETTRRYLGVAQDDLDKAYLGVALF